MGERDDWIPSLLLLQPQVAFEHQPGLVSVAFWTQVARTALYETELFHWPTDTTWNADVDVNVAARVVRDDGVEALLDFNLATVRVQVGNGNVWGTVAATTRAACEEVVAQMEEWFPKSVATEGEVPMTFWSYSPNGPRSISRKIDVASWDDVEGNYAADAREQVARMMRDFRPSHGGQLILWQGIPGTGKTWALRALASEWRGWADFHYITDPEVFFGDRADYMLDVLLDQSDEFITVETTGEPPSQKEPRWRVLLLEDTGEILAADAKEKTGQALSRLLNVVDGLIGQGLRILVLVTTNEELKKLHPAVSRPGRCAARIEFGELSGDEAVAWAEERGVEVQHGRATIAELYALAEDREAADEVPIGFVQS